MMPKPLVSSSYDQNHIQVIDSDSMDLNLFSHFEEGPVTATKHTTRKRIVTSSSSSSSSKREKLEENSTEHGPYVNTTEVKATVTYSAIPSGYDDHIAVNEKGKMIDQTMMMSELIMCCNTCGLSITVSEESSNEGAC